MGWIDVLLPARRGRQVAMLARDVALRSRQPVRERLSADVAYMTQAEARGYVRARAAAVVQHQVDLAFAPATNVPPAERAEIVRTSSEQVTSLVLCDLFQEGIGLRVTRRAG